jgi:hypothetical protein
MILSQSADWLAASVDCTAWRWRAVVLIQVPSAWEHEFGMHARALTPSAKQLAVVHNIRA